MNFPTVQTDEFEAEFYILKTIETFEKTTGSLEQRLEEQDARLGKQETTLREREGEIATFKQIINAFNGSRY